MEGGALQLGAVKRVTNTEATNFFPRSGGCSTYAARPLRELTRKINNTNFATSVAGYKGGRISRRAFMKGN